MYSDCRRLRNLNHVRVHLLSIAAKMTGKPYMMYYDINYMRYSHFDWRFRPRKSDEKAAVRLRHWTTG